MVAISFRHLFLKERHLFIGYYLTLTSLFLDFNGESVLVGMEEISLIHVGVFVSFVVGGIIEEAIVGSPPYRDESEGVRTKNFEYDSYMQFVSGRNVDLPGVGPHVYVLLGLCSRLIEPLRALTLLLVSLASSLLAGDHTYIDSKAIRHVCG